MVDLNKLIDGFRNENSRTFEKVRIVKILLENSLSTKKICELLGITRSYVSKISKISIDRLRGIPDIDQYSFRQLISVSKGEKPKELKSRCNLGGEYFNTKKNSFINTIYENNTPFLNIPTNQFDLNHSVQKYFNDNFLRLVSELEEKNGLLDKLKFDISYEGKSQVAFREMLTWAETCKRNGYKLEYNIQRPKLTSYSMGYIAFNHYKPYVNPKIIIQGNGNVYAREIYEPDIVEAELNELKIQKENSKNGHDGYADNYFRDKHLFEKQENENSIFHEQCKWSNSLEVNAYNTFDYIKPKDNPRKTQLQEVEFCFDLYCDDLDIDDTLFSFREHASRCYSTEGENFTLGSGSHSEAKLAIYIKDRALKILRLEVRYRVKYLKAFGSEFLGSHRVSNQPIDMQLTVLRKSAKGLIQPLIKSLKVHDVELAQPATTLTLISSLIPYCCNKVFEELISKNGEIEALSTKDQNHFKAVKKLVGAEILERIPGKKGRFRLTMKHRPFVRRLTGRHK